jgi:undecaprenyl phosphate-alpha-L-ara4N flippase subunit ArnE
MFRSRLGSGLESVTTHALATGNFGLLAINLFFNVLANTSFKFSATSPNWRGILAWQVLGNLSGLITVITLTLLMRTLPIRVAVPMTIGMTVIGVQIVAARLVFHEPISPLQWLGTVLVVAGIALIGSR